MLLTHRTLAGRARPLRYRSDSCLARLSSVASLARGPERACADSLPTTRATISDTS